MAMLCNTVQQPLSIQAQLLDPASCSASLGTCLCLKHPVLYRGHVAVGGYAGWLQTPSSVFVLAPVGEKGVVGEALVLTSEPENIGMHLGGCVHHILTVPPQSKQQQQQQMEQRAKEDLEQQQQQIPLSSQQLEQQQQDQLKEQQHQQQAGGCPHHTAENSDQSVSTDSQGGLGGAWDFADTERERAVEWQQQLTAALKTHIDSCFAAVQQRATKQKQQSVLVAE